MSAVSLKLNKKSSLMRVQSPTHQLQVRLLRISNQTFRPIPSLVVVGEGKPLDAQSGHVGAIVQTSTRVVGEVSELVVTTFITACRASRVMRSCGFPLNKGRDCGTSTATFCDGWPAEEPSH